jgi:hypothetical protein
MPAARITLPHFSVSSAIALPYWSGVGERPCGSSRHRPSGVTGSKFEDSATGNLHREITPSAGAHQMSFRRKSTILNSFVAPSSNQILALLRRAAFSSPGNHALSHVNRSIRFQLIGEML